MKSMLALMAGAMVFAACSNDDTLENINEQTPSALKPMIFTASMEGQGGTRAAIDGLDIKWTSGDKISIFDGEADEDGNLAREFVLTGGVGSTAGTFEGKAAENATAYYGLYPCVESVYKVSEEEREVTEDDLRNLEIEPQRVFDMKGMYQFMGEDMLEDLPHFIPEYEELSDEGKAIVLACIKGEKIKLKTTTEKGVQRDGDNFTNIVLPAEQTATAGSADMNAMLMIAKSTDASTMEFKNVCAFVKVTPQFDCTGIVLCSNGTESLAGTLTVNYNEGAPTTTVTANGTNTIYLNGTITNGNTYYIAVRPETLNSGFTIIFKTSDGRYKKSTSKNVSFTRNNVTNLGSFAKSNLTLAPTTCTATRTGGINVNCVQLWDNGPLFAEYNVGATSATEYGGYYTWGGTYTNGEGIAWNDDHYTGSENLSGTYDTATNLWGSNWRMPTNIEFKALVAKCTWTWTDNYNGTEVVGLICTGKGDYSSNSIFFPIAGLYYITGSYYKNQFAYYWSTVPVGSNQGAILNLSYDASVGSTDRYFGCSVRAVLAK